MISCVHPAIFCFVLFSLWFCVCVSFSHPDVWHMDLYG